jgi:hypothetical protein
MSVMEMRLVIEEVIAHSKRRCLGLQETAESCSQSFPLGSILTIWCEQADRLLSGKLCDPLSLSLTVYGLLRGLRCLEERLRTEQGSNGPLLIVLPSDLVIGNIIAGWPLDVTEVARDVAVLRSALPDPEPSFVARVHLDGFRQALDMQASQSARRRLSTLATSQINHV